MAANISLRSFFSGSTCDFNSCDRCVNISNLSHLIWLRIQVFFCWRVPIWLFCCCLSPVTVCLTAYLSPCLLTTSLSIYFHLPGIYHFQPSTRHKIHTTG